MTEEEKFATWARSKGLDLEMTIDAWGAPVHARSHIVSMWAGWQGRAALASAGVAAQEVPTESADRIFWLASDIGICPNEGDPARLSYTERDYQFSPEQLLEFVAATQPPALQGVAVEKDAAPHFSITSEQAGQIAQDAEGKFRHQPGAWLLTAPDGTQWKGDSPMAVLKLERDSRIPASVQLARVLSMANEPEPLDRATVQALMVMWGDADEHGRRIGQGNKVHNDAQESWLRGASPTLESMTTVTPAVHAFNAGWNKALDAVLQGVAVETPWQPIETAPRDDTEILVMYMHIETQIVHVGFWLEGDECESPAGWWTYTHSEVSRELLDGWRAPTHWMPLPPPPASQGAQP